MDFLNEYHLSGLVIGICTFLIIGIFHPIVVKAEYYWGTKCWWIFLLLGIGGAIASLCTDNILVASLLGVFVIMNCIKPCVSLERPIHSVKYSTLYATSVYSCKFLTDFHIMQILFSMFSRQVT